MVRGPGDLSRAAGFAGNLPDRFGSGAAGLRDVARARAETAGPRGGESDYASARTITNGLRVEAAISSSIIDVPSHLSPPS